MGTFANAFAAGFKPALITTISEWADKYRVLSRKASSEPGLWRTDRTHHLREIMDEMSLFRPSRKIVIMKGAQLGVSEAIMNAVGFHVMIDPCPMLVIYPTEQLAKKMAGGRFDTMVEASPELRDLVGRRSNDGDDKRGKKETDTLLVKDFVGGGITFGSAASPNALSSISAKILLADEVDRMPVDVKSEGDPLALASERTSAMSRAKLVFLSTPTEEGKSIIAEEFDRSDQRFYFIPCPKCNETQILLLDNFRYEIEAETGLSTDAYFQCIHCQGRIDEQKKSWFLPLGRYIPTKKGAYIGFHVSQFYAPPGWKSWRMIATQYHECLNAKNHAKMTVFHNTVLGLPFSEPSKRQEWEAVYRRREDFPTGICPETVLVLTGGADVQENRIELQVLGHCRNGEIYVVDYQTFLGDTASKQVWDDFELFLRKPLPRIGSDVLIPISTCCLDAGYRSTKVYDFVRRFLPGRRVVPIKGRDSMIVPITRPTKLDQAQARTSEHARRGIELFPVGVSVLKETVYSRLGLEIDIESGKVPEEFVHFPELPAEYFKQLCAEESKSIRRNGQDVKVWSKIYERNEALDTFVYAMAATFIIGMNKYTNTQWDQISGMLNPIVDFKSDSVGVAKSLDVARTSVKSKRKPSSFW